MVSQIFPGWDVVLVARESTAGAEWSEVQAGVASLVRRAGLTMEPE